MDKFETKVWNIHKWKPEFMTKLTLIDIEKEKKNSIVKREWFIAVLPGGGRVDVVARIEREQLADEWESAFWYLTGMKRVTQTEERVLLDTWSPQQFSRSTWSWTETHYGIVLIKLNKEKINKLTIYTKLIDLVEFF